MKALIREQKHFPKDKKTSLLFKKIESLAKKLPLQACLRFILQFNKKLNSKWKDDNLYDLLSEEIQQILSDENKDIFKQLQNQDLMESRYTNFHYLGSFLLLGKPLYCNALIEIVSNYCINSECNTLNDFQTKDLAEIIELFYSIECIKVNKISLSNEDKWRFDLEYYLEHNGFDVSKSSLFITQFFIDNKSQIPKISNIDFKSGHIQTLIDTMEVYTKGYSWNQYLIKKIEQHGNIEKKYIEDISIKLGNLVARVKNKNNGFESKPWSQRGSIFEDMIWGYWCIKIDGEYWLLPYHNLLLNTYSIKFILNSQRSFNKIDDFNEEEWRNIEDIFEKWIFTKFKGNENIENLSKISVDGSELGDIIFTSNKALFIGDVKLISIKEDSKINKGVGKIAFGEFNTQIKKIYEQRTKQLKYLQNGRYSNRLNNFVYEKIYHFVIVPDFFDIEHTPNKFSNEYGKTLPDIKSFSVWKNKYNQKYVDIIFIPYSKVDEMIKDPITYCLNSGYL